VVHDAVCGGQDNVSESTRRKDILNPLLEVLWGTASEARRGGGQGTHPNTAIKSWGNNAAFIDTPNKIHDNLTRAVVIEDLELTNVT
jgi:hypothetical protein